MVINYELLKVIHHPTKFSSHRHCGSGDIIGHVMI